KRSSIQASSERLIRLPFHRTPWIFLFFEYVLPQPLGVQGASVQQCPQSRGLVFLGQNVQMLFGTIKLARKTKQFEKECPALVVGGVVSDLSSQSLKRILEFAGF